MESERADKRDSRNEAEIGVAALRSDDVHDLWNNESSTKLQLAASAKADRSKGSVAGPPELSTSPSSLSQSLSSALVAAIKVPSFSGAFKKSSSSAVEQSVGDLNEQAPSDQFGLSDSFAPSSTSYFPSPATFTSFFSGGSKPRAIPSPTSPPLATTSASSAPRFAEPSRENQADVMTSAGTSAPTGASDPNISVQSYRFRVSYPPTTEPLSVTPGSVPSSSLTQLMKAAAPFFTSGPKQATETEAGAEGQSVDGLQPGKQFHFTGRVSTSAGPSEGFPNNPERSAEVTTSIYQPSRTPAEAKIAPLASCSQANVTVEGILSSRSSEPPLLTSPLDIQSSYPQDFRPATSSPELPVSTAPGHNHPAHLDLEQESGSLSRDTPPGSAPQETAPGKAARDIPPQTFANIAPSTASQAASPVRGPQETNPDITSQDAQPGTSAQATSPSTSYLSLPSFLPTWSTITAQLPSMPGAPFLSREQESGLTSAATKQPFPTPPSNLVSGVPDTGQPVGTAAEPVGASPALNYPSQQAEPRRLPSTATGRTDPAVDVTSREAAGQRGSNPGVEEQAAVKPEFDLHSAAAVDAIAKGLAGVLGPVTMEADKQVEAALRSQEKLAMSIDRLTRGLDKLLEESPQPLVAQQAARLAHMRKRVQALAATLKVIQGRIDSMNWALDRKSSRAQFARGRSATAPNSPHSYQAVTDPVGQNRHSVPGIQSGGSGTQVLEVKRSDGSESTGAGGQVSGSSVTSSGGPDLGNLLSLGAERVSSRSPKKGHRRAVSHDVRLSGAFSNKR